MRLCLFGSTAVERSGVTHALPIPVRAIVMLAYLAVHGTRPLSRGAVASALWPDVSEGDGRANLRRYLHLTTAAVPEIADALVVTKTSVRWNDEAPLRCDVRAFCSAASEARADDALRAYAGELCAGIVDEALEPLRATIEQLVATMLATSVERATATGDRATALLGLQRLIERDPYDEDLACRLVRLRFEGGDRSGAVRDYEAFRARLRSDLDAAPESDAAASIERLLRGDPRPHTPHNLTRPLTSFLARESELQTVLEELRTQRVFSIVGSGGMGKTRLAIEAGYLLLERFSRGVWFVDLSRSCTLQAAAERIAEVVAAPRTADAFDGVATSLQSDDVLLVLDNLEQLGDDAQRLVEALRSRTAARYLTTSRRRFEATIPAGLTLGPLRVPPAAPAPPDALAEYSAVRLFLERATRVAPGLRVDYDSAHSLGNIVRALDGVPLAIEIVASRANLLTLDGIAKRLADHLGFSDRRRAERHVSIEAAIAWSYDVLTPLEQRVFRSIAVFGTSWTLEAFESVCEPLAGFDFVAVASELLESSLLQSEHAPDGIRFAGYESTRGYAATRLAELGEYDARAGRHLAYYLPLAQRLARDFTTEREQDAFERCDRERSNFEAALAWACARDRAAAAKLASALARYWIFRGRSLEGFRTLTELEAMGIDELSTLDTARFAFAAGMLAREVAFDRADAYLGRALNAYRACSNKAGEFEVLFALAATAFTRNDMDDADVRYGACLAEAEANGDQRAAAACLVNLAQIAWTREDFDAALDLLERARSGFERTQNPRGIAHVFRSRSVIFGSLGRTDEAIAQAREAVILFEQLADPTRLAEALTCLADAHSTARNFDDAFAVVRRAFTILERAPHDVFLLHAMNSTLLAAAGVGAFEDALRIHAAAAALATRIGRPPEGLNEFADVVVRARAALPHAVAEAAIASGVALGAAYCERVIDRHLEHASDARRTLHALP